MKTIRSIAFQLLLALATVLVGILSQMVEKVTLEAFLLITVILIIVFISFWLGFEFRGLIKVDD